MKLKSNDERFWVGDTIASKINKISYVIDSFPTDRYGTEYAVIRSIGRGSSVFVITEKELCETFGLM